MNPYRHINSIDIRKHLESIKYLFGVHDSSIHSALCTLRKSTLPVSIFEIKVTAFTTWSCGIIWRQNAIATHSQENFVCCVHPATARKMEQIKKYFLQIYRTILSDKSTSSSALHDITQENMTLTTHCEPEPVRIWLDDLRKAPPKYMWCKSVNAAIYYIELCEKAGYYIEVIDCDHDLGDYAKDGGDGIKLIDWLVERKSFYPIKLHTMNPVGRENMQTTIDRYWPTRKK